MAAQGIIFVTPVDITPGAPTGAAWNTIDITSNVGGDAGDVVGCIVEIFSGPQAFGLQHGDATADTLWPGLFENDWRHCATGVNTSDVFEVYFNSWTGVTVYLVGYIVSEAGYFLTDFADWTPTSINTWTSKDPQTDYGDGQGDTVAAVIMNFTSGPADRSMGVRPKGGTGTTYTNVGSGGVLGVWGSGVGTGADAGKVQTYASDVSGNKVWCYFAGYLNDGYIETMDPPTDYATATTGSYVDVDVTEISETSDGALGVLFASSNLSAYVTKDNTVTDRYGVGTSDIRHVAGFFVGVDADGIFEQKIESVDVDLDVWGWVKQGGAAGGGRIMSSLVAHGGLVGAGGIAGATGGLAG